jgi:hypothetical protein
MPTSVTDPSGCSVWEPQELHPDVASCSTRWDNGDYLDNISRDFYKALGATGPDWRPIDWIFSEFGSCQGEPQIPELTNSSKETGDEHSWNALTRDKQRPNGPAAATRDQKLIRRSFPFFICKDFCFINLYNEEANSNPSFMHSPLTSRLFAKNVINFCQPTHPPIPLVHPFH